MYKLSKIQLIALLLVRIIGVVLFQFFLLFFLSTWDKTIPWWPFAMIMTEIVCCLILIKLLRLENKSFWSIQYMPFDKSLPFGKVSRYINGNYSKNRSINFVINLMLFIALLLLLGFPAILIKDYIYRSVPILNEINIFGVLPGFALCTITLLLPITQALIEFPWFFGYIYPRLEASFDVDGKNAKIKASLKSFTIVIFFFTLQTALIPLIINFDYFIWRAIAMIPILIVIGIVVRVFPRFMPHINVLHAVMAISVVMEYWKLV